MTNSQSPRVLLLANVYPPSRYCEIAGQRPAKFAQYLPEFGWDTIVVTRFWDERSREGHFALPEKMPAVRDWDPQSAAEIANTKRNCTIQVPFRVTHRQRAQLRIRQLGENRPWIVPLRKAVAAAQRMNLNSTGTDWLTQAGKAVEAVCSQQSIGCLIATAPPPDTLRLAQALSSRLRIPWIADLRDRIADQFPNNHPLTHKRTKMLRAMLNSASAVLVVSEEIADSEQATWQLDRRPIVIPNGFDESEYADLKRHTNREFEICYTGSFYPRRYDPRAFFGGLKLFAERNPEVRSKPIFRHMGTSSYAFQNAIGEFDIGDLVCDAGHVSRRSALESQVQATALLLLTDCRGVPGIATGKIYEYLAARRPILAVPGDDSTADRLIRTTNAGYIAKTDKEVSDRLQAFYDEWKVDRMVSYSPCDAEVAKYSRRNQAKRLAGLLDEIVSCTGSQIKVPPYA